MRIDHQVVVFDAAALRGEQLPSSSPDSQAMSSVLDRTLGRTAHIELRTSAQQRKTSSANSVPIRV